ncbi:hypothetical protein QN277_001773 [Acacia crassicarpa]|uniref:DUF659 domain-containing protein n=1 Tax=Acacia crassicarpa TaxID=499986 RepID=A0AAE1N9E7_9FABA|nr:hypothetical protein QN277_001773 [Acacia crassicarpa]
MASQVQEEVRPVASVASCGLVKPTGENLDMAWQWNSLKDINKKRYVTCDFCGKETTGGITRAKKHQIWLKGDVGPCKKIPPEIKKMVKDAYMQKVAEKDVYCVDTHEDDDILEEVQEIQHIKNGKRTGASSSQGTDGNSAAAKRVKGPLDLMFFKKPEASYKASKGKRQTSLNDACDKEARGRTIQYIERFLCTNGIPFNVVRSKSFKYMVQAIGNYGPNLKLPSYYECRVPLLKKELDYTNDLLKDHAVQRANYGCSIMSDEWTDRKNRTLINFLVNSPSGSMFVKSVDASSYVKSGAKLFELLDNFVEEIGEKNVVQVVTDNGSNYVLVDKT